MHTILDPKAATAAAIVFDSGLPYVFAPGAEIHEVALKWDGCIHPELRRFTITAKVQGPGAPVAVAVTADVSVRLTSDGWTDCLFEWMGYASDPRLRARYHVDLNGRPEPSFQAV